jgi:ParB family transcriptional regulator, chromosome partitioning protein
MGSFWKIKANDKQLHLAGVDPLPPVPAQPDKPTRSTGHRDSHASVTPTLSDGAATTANIVTAKPLTVLVTSLCEDPNNPRTEFPDDEIDELAGDIRQHGILQPIVVHPADARGRYLIHFGAKRWRAAQRAGLTEVPVVMRDAPADPYAQVAENQKRHGLTPLDLARFIKSRVDAGESNAAIAKRLGMNLTTVAHHLALLALPPELDQVFKSGRCTSPRTLHELSKLHDNNPNQVQGLLAGGSEITRTTVSALRAAADDGAPSEVAPTPSNRPIAQAHAACDRLERALGRIRPSSSYKVALPELITLRIRVEDITKHWLQGSDRQTPMALP